jgi:hypothetical protein
MTSTNPYYKYVLYVKASGAGSPSFEAAKSNLDELGKREDNLHVETVDVSGLNEVQREGIADDIRAIPPQVRGRVVSGGGMTLALSRTKNLNFDNTPILIVRDGSGRPIAVFPHALGEKVESVENHLRKALEAGVETALHQRSVPTEELLTEIISLVPSIVEEGMRELGRELPTPTGTIDLLLADRNGTPVVVEVEVTASEQAVGQVCKLAEGYVESIAKQATSEGSAPMVADKGKVRKAIVCLRTKGMLQQACRSANVELYHLATERLE